jgi:hypothetical protein
MVLCGTGSQTRSCRAKLVRLHRSAPLSATDMHPLGILVHEKRVDGYSARSFKFNASVSHESVVFTEDILLHRE